MDSDILLSLGVRNSPSSHLALIWRLPLLSGNRLGGSLAWANDSQDPAILDDQDL